MGVFETCCGTSFGQITVSKRKKSRIQPEGEEKRLESHEGGRERERKGRRGGVCKMKNARYVHIGFLFCRASLEVGRSQSV
jgi:hypothetical protein